MKVILAGGSGQIGTVLARAFHGRGDEVVILSRNPAASGAPWRNAGWDSNEIDGSDIVINLAGRSVDCRYNPANRKEILSSRVDTTLALGRAIAAAKQPPKVWLQSSTATIYAHRYDTPNDEFTGILGGGELQFHLGRAARLCDSWEFSISVAKSWEAAFDSCTVPNGCRKVVMRSAMVMSPDHGGVFDVLLRLVRFGLGGRAGDGRQYVSWIHDQDFVRAILWLIEHEEMDGAVNLASPGPVPNAEFMRLLRKAWGMPVGLPAADWMVEVGAFFLRTESELILKSRRVVPGRLAQSGFRFEYPEWGAAARDLCSRWRASGR